MEGGHWRSCCQHQIAVVAEEVAAIVEGPSNGSGISPIMLRSPDNIQKVSYSKIMKN